MTVLLIMEAIDSGRLSYTDQIPCSENASSMGGSQIWLDTKETLSVDEMLKAICVVSANDCTVAMAEYLAGSEENFVAQMNAKAKELGMNDTTFKNCHGIDEDGHVSSSYDIALMSRELLEKHPDITKYTTIYMDSLRDGKSELVNTNKLVRNYRGATGLKTGSTSLALYNLSASATRDGLSLIAVIIPFFWKLFPFTRESGYVQIKLSSLLLWGKIIVATIPAAIVGFFFDDAINAAFYNPMSIAIALIVVGFVFIAVERAKKGKKVRVSRLSDITFLMAFVIGMFQTIAAVFPGTSRSGITIIAMLLMGFSRKLAVEFTFLLAIPVMLGASLAKLVKFGFHFVPNEALLLLIGVVVAFLVSIFVIRFIVGYIKKHTFIAFGWYRIILGVAVIVLFKMFL